MCALAPAGPDQVSLADAYGHFLATGGIPEQDRGALIKAVRCGEIPHRVGSATEHRRGLKTPADPPGLAPREESPPPHPLPLMQIPPEMLAHRLALTFKPFKSSARWRDPKTGSIIVFTDITVSRDAVLRSRPARSDEPQRQ